MWCRRSEEQCALKGMVMLIAFFSFVAGLTVLALWIGK